MSDDDCEQEDAKENTAVNDGGASLIRRIFGALSNQRRRHILYYLRDHKQAQTDELAVQIAAWERDIPISEVPSEEAETVSTDLVHSHLPKLENYGLIEYDRRSETVSYTYPPSLLDEALELAVTIENPP